MQCVQGGIYQAQADSKQEDTDQKNNVSFRKAISKESLNHIEGGDRYHSQQRLC